jgi:asparagine synthase (glutamine-hydrolysing)
MCGICGDLRFGGEASAEAIAAMMRAMAPRGPDGGGMLVRDGTGFGHRRLNIIDLSDKAAQPMTDGTLGLSIAFNGCIYNYPELRKELEGKGYGFFSNGDTEVILKAWHAWGPRCVERFKGMFAFAVHERDTGRVALVRDRFGIKPLYLAETPGRVRFASSLLALLATGDIDTSIDRVGLAHYMTFHAVVPPPHTILTGVRKLPPATIRIYESDGSHVDDVYWRLDFGRSREDIERPFEEWREMVLEALRTAVARRMVADVPVGVLLSGGVDSSVIVGLLAEMGQRGLNTFSIGFEEAHGEKGDEFVYSDLIAKTYDTKHHKIFVPSLELLTALPETIAAQSEPMVSYDNVGFFLLSREVAKHIKVVQSGQGADEVFAGYHWYPPLTASNDPIGDYAKVFFDRDLETLKTHLSPDYRADGDAALDFVRDAMAMPGADAAVDKALRLDTTVMLVDDPVKRVDNMTMRHGLEARVPFLDHDLVELAARIPAEHKLAHGGKGVLKEASRKVIPGEVIDREKGYFPVPALKYIEGPYLGLVQDALTSRPARERGLFRKPYLEALFADPTAHITPLRGSELWQVAVLEMWLQQHGI